MQVSEKWRVSISIAAIASSLLIAGSAWAQARGGDRSDIVVTGQRFEKAEIARFVAAVGTSSHGQQPRMIRPACPSVLGIPSPYSDQVKARIRENAATAGVSVAAEPCTPNVVLAFTDPGADAQKVLAQVLRRQPTREDLAHADTGEPHILYWASVTTLSSDGLDTTSQTLSSQFGTRALYVPSASIIKTQTIEAVDWSVLAIEKPAAVGKSLHQLADYATMRLIGMAKPPSDDGGPPTILNLFAADPVAAMTPFDAAYLSALFRTAIDQPASRTREAVARAMIAGAAQSTEQ